jgi:nitrogen regulatory protein P-II 1
MNFRKVTAIIQSTVLEKVEQALRETGVNGISVTKVKGYGEYANFYTQDMMVSHARIEIFTYAENAERIAAAIMNAAHTGVTGDGIVAILPVEKVFHIRSKAEATPEDL